MPVTVMLLVTVVAPDSTVTFEDAPATVIAPVVTDPLCRSTPLGAPV